MEVSKVLHYKGYTTKAEFSEEDGLYYGQLLGISDMVFYQADSLEEVEREFQEAVEDYLAYCAEMGREPQKGVAQE